MARREFSDAERAALDEIADQAKPLNEDQQNVIRRAFSGDRAARRAIADQRHRADRRRAS